MNVKTILDVFKSHGLDLGDPQNVLKALDLLKNFRAAKDEKTRNQIVKTALRTVLPMPFSMMAGEILVRLRKAIKPLDLAIKNGIP